jgi:hypothetical protein
MLKAAIDPRLLMLSQIFLAQNEVMVSPDG